MGFQGTGKVRLRSRSAPSTPPANFSDLFLDSASGNWKVIKSSGTIVDLEATGGGGVTDGDKTDITVSSSGTVWTIDADVVTYAKMQNVSATNRFLGRITAGSGDPEEISGTQATTLLDTVTSTLKGLAPASGGGSVNFLRADGTWAVPPGAGGGTFADNVFTLQDNVTSTKQAQFELTNISAGTTRTFTLPNTSDTLVTLGAVQTLTAKTFDSSDIFNVRADRLTLEDQTTSTKKIQFNVALVSAGVTRSVQLPDDDIVVTGTAATQTLTNKTISGASNTITNLGTSTLSDNAVTYAKMQDVSVTDRLLGRDTAGAGDPEEIAVTGGLEFTGSAGIQRSALTGDVTASAGSNTTTIAADAVTYAKLQNISTNAVVLGRISPGAGNAEELAGSQVNSFLPQFSSTTQGVVAASGGGTVNMLRADGTWTTVGTTNIAADAVTYAKMQNMSATNQFLGRITAGSGDVEELSASQATSILNVFTSSLKGLAPSSGGGTSTFLRADGTWAAPPGGSGEANTASNVGVAGVGVWKQKTGVNLEFKKINAGPGFGLGATISVTDDTTNDEIDLDIVAAGIDMGTLNGQIDGTTQILNASIANARLANMAARTVKARAAATTGAPVDLASSVDGSVLRQAGTTLSWGTLSNAASFADNTLTYAKLQDVSATARFLGRITAGAGDIEELSGTQGTSLLDNFTSSLKGLAPASGGGGINFLRADGTWTQVAMEATFVPARKFGAVPTGGDQTTNIQNALDNVPVGSVLTFEPGDYIANGVNLTRSDISIMLPPGCRLYTTGTTTRGTLHINGTIDTSASVSVIQNPSTTDDLAWPRGGDRSIWVASDPGSNYAADKWFSIEDLESRPGGLSSDPNYILEHHMELCRVKAKTSVTGGYRIDLWFPLVNSYTNVSSVAPKLRSVVPLTNISVWGGGTIENGTAPSGGSAQHGLTCAYVVGLSIHNIRIKNCYNSALHILRCQDFRVTNCDIRDALKFDGTGGYGYGMNIYGAIRGTVQGNVMRRLRHCIDVSFFSRQLTIDGNSMVGSTTTNLNTHACVEGLVISNNVIDGAFGQDAATGSVDYGSAVVANGINIDENNKNIAIVGNTIRNCTRAGILVDPGSSSSFKTEFVSIVGNVLENCVTARRFTSPPSGYTDIGAITVTERSNGGNDRRGFIIKGNTLREPGQFGILCDLSNVMIEGNWIYLAEDKTQTDDAPTIGIGIWVRGATTADTLGVVVRNNITTTCRQNGIRIGGDAASYPHAVTDCVVEGNLCTANLDAGLFLEDTAAFIKVRGNQCYQNVDDGLNTQGHDCWFEENWCVGNGNWGFRLITGANNNLIHHNLYAANTSGSVSDVGTGNLHNELDSTGGFVYNKQGGSTAPFDVRGPFVFNETGANIDARFEGDTDANTLMVDASADSVGVGVATPQRKFHVFYQDSTNNTVVQLARIQRSTSNAANGAAGIGIGIEMASEDSSGSTQILAQLDAIQDTATAAAEDSSLRVKVYDGGTQKEVIRIDGAVPGVLISNNATGTPAERLDVDANIRAQALIADGDANGGASTNAFTGTSDITTNSTGVGSIKFKGATSRDSTGFIKVYIGTTAYYVPVFAAITG